MRNTYICYKSTKENIFHVGQNMENAKTSVSKKQGGFIEVWSNGKYKTTFRMPGAEKCLLMEVK